MVGTGLTPRLAIESVWKQFGRRPVLRNASVWAYAGAVTVLFGRNGEGKSTLLRCGLGLLRKEVGVTILGNRRHHHPSLAGLARDGLFFLPDRDLFSPQLPVRAHLRALLARFPEAVPARLEALVQDPAMLDRHAWQLSGGERRRAEVGFAGARGPVVLVADEPLRGLAPLDGQAVADYLRTLAAEGCAVLVTGHEARALLDIADHVVWMTGGTTHHLGTRDAALAHDQFRENYLRHF
jgi:ABC-type multidrug transport system ATPase subunit